MNYDEAIEKIKTENLTITSFHWNLCKTIRQATDADFDYINCPPEGIIVEDCENRACDCKIAVHVPTEEDKKHTDYIIAV